MPTATELRSAIRQLSSLAAADIRFLWRHADDPRLLRDALLDTLPALIDTYGLASSALAADWYDDVRDEIRAAGAFSAVPAKLEKTGADELARWGVGPLFSESPDVDAARSKIEGGLQRRIANASRETVAFSAVQDPGADGWQRVGRGECAFCAMLISRGAVYRESTAAFASHDHCNCQAVPAFRGAPRPVKPYTPTNRDITDADRARVRDYLASHDAG